MKKSFFIFIITLIFTSALFLSAQNFIHMKMKKEIFIYYELTDKMQILNDTYALCSGLILTNPSDQNIDSCNLVFKEIKVTIDEIDEKCPYISFYTKYISKI